MNFKFICSFSKYILNISKSCKPWFLPSYCSYSSWGGELHTRLTDNTRPCHVPSHTWCGLCDSCSPSGSTEIFYSFATLTTIALSSNIRQWLNVSPGWGVSLGSYLSSAIHYLCDLGQVTQPVWAWCLLCKMRTLIVPTSQSYSENQMN